MGDSRNSGFGCINKKPYRTTLALNNVRSIITADVPILPLEPLIKLTEIKIEEEIIPLPGSKLYCEEFLIAENSPDKTKKRKLEEDGVNIPPKKQKLNNSQYNFNCDEDFIVRVYSPGCSYPFFKSGCASREEKTKNSLELDDVSYFSIAAALSKKY